MSPVEPTPIAQKIERCVGPAEIWDAKGSRGFTLVEAMVAAIVLVLVIVPAITTLQRGFQSLDSARNPTTASQLMQSEMERLRLKNWSQIEELHNTGVTQISTEGSRFVCTLANRDLKGTRMIFLHP